MDSKYTNDIEREDYSNEKNLDELVAEAKEVLRKAEPSLQFQQAIYFIQHPRNPESVARPYIL